jgi:hypothetical protein
MWPDFERYGYVRCAQHGGKTRSVVEQRFSRPDLDQRGRETSYIGIEG